MNLVMMHNPGKNIPLAMIISTIIVSIIYLGVGFVATGVLPVEGVAFKTLGSVAKEIFLNLFIISSWLAERCLLLLLL